jgi:sporulation-control protein spo0M
LNDGLISQAGIAVLLSDCGPKAGFRHFSKRAGIIMGFFDKLKGMVNAVTGGAAKVTIQLQQACVFPGESVGVKITATSTGAEVKSKGVYVDVHAEERVSFRDDETKQEINRAKTTTDQTIQIAPAFVLAPNETKTFEGSFQMPADVLPTFNGSLAQHVCQVRGRIEAFGNDPDSGYQVINVGSKN